MDARHFQEKSKGTQVSLLNTHDTYLNHSQIERSSHDSLVNLTTPSKQVHPRDGHRIHADITVISTMDENPKRSESHSLSEKETNTEEHKGKTTLAAIFDGSFPLPALTADSSVLSYVLSFGTLLALIAGGIGGAWYLGYEILQSSQPLVMGGIITVVAMFAFWITGTIWVDWFELVIGYWWLSMPIGALAGLAVVLNAEASATMAETE